MHVYVYTYTYTFTHILMQTCFFPQDPRKMSAFPKQIEQMTESEYGKHVFGKMRKFNESQASQDGNEDVLEEIKKMEFEPKVPNWTKDEEIRGINEYGGIEGHEFQDPSKMLFESWMVQRAKSWKKDAALAKDKMILELYMEIQKNIGEIDFFFKIGKIFTAEKILILAVILGITAMIQPEILEIVKIILAMIIIAILCKMGPSIVEMRCASKIAMAEHGEMKWMAKMDQIAQAKIQVSMVVRGGNINRLLMMNADKTSAIEHRLQSMTSYQVDTGRSITNYLCTNWNANLDYQKYGLAKIAKTWTEARRMAKDWDSDKDIATHLSAQWEKIWKVAFKCFFESVEGWKKTAQKSNDTELWEKIQEQSQGVWAILENNPPKIEDYLV